MTLYTVFWACLQRHRWLKRKTTPPSSPYSIFVMFVLSLLLRADEVWAREGRRPARGKRKGGGTGKPAGATLKVTGGHFRRKALLANFFVHIGTVTYSDPEVLSMNSSIQCYYTNWSVTFIFHIFMYVCVKSFFRLCVNYFFCVSLHVYLFTYLFIH